jgi:predicted nucleic acid-binding Zn ribbon protein
VIGPGRKPRKRKSAEPDLSKPTPLGSALDAWIAKSGLARRLQMAEVVAGWGELVGPQIAAVTRALSVTPDGTLMVRVASHTWATELGLMTPRILARVNGSRTERVYHIRWQVGPLDGP